MNEPEYSKRLFLWLLAPQLLLCLLYWIFGVDTQGGETGLQRLVLGIYRPVVYAVMIPGAFFGWAGAGFAMAFSPLIGAFVYAYVIARLARGPAEAEEPSRP